MDDIIEQEYDYSKEITIWMNNLENFKQLVKNKKRKPYIIFGNESIHCQMIFIRRLFVDWLNVHKNNSDLLRYSLFKRSLKKYIKKNELSSDIFVQLWIDFNNFLIRHADFVLEIYDYCMYSYTNRRLNKFIKLYIFSIICVNSFFKWRKKRNDMIRKWIHYDKKRKKKFNYNFSDTNASTILNEAKSSISLLNPNVKFFQ
jgi:hypothetical protein